MSRISNRKNDEARRIEMIPNFLKHAMGSCLISCGDTKVICAATIENKVPAFVKGTGQGWLSAEYSLLPSATHTRCQRERSKISGRTQEIQRLIGRSLRSCVDLEKLGERTIIIDADVIQADGGTRCASICGGYLALEIAIKKLMEQAIDNELLSLYAYGCFISILFYMFTVKLFYRKGCKPGSLHTSMQMEVCSS